MADDEGELQALRQKVSELQKQLKSHVWTVALVTVSNMEEAALGIKMDAEEATLPRRIAALEKSVFGRSASEADLEHWSRVDDDFKKLQLDYEELKLEYIKEREKPPQIIKQDDGRTQQLETDLRKSHGMYQVLNSKYTTLNVDHLKLETEFKGLSKAHEKLKAEAEEFKAEAGSRIKRLQEQSTKTAVELKRLRGSNAKMWEEHKSLQMQHDRVAGDTRALELLRAKYDAKQGQLDELESEANTLRDENHDIKNKFHELRKKMGQGASYDGPGNATKSACADSQELAPDQPAPAQLAPKEHPRKGSKERRQFATSPPGLSSPGSVSLPRLPTVDESQHAEVKPERTMEEAHRLGDEEFFNKFPELREPQDAKDSAFKNKMMHINGRVKYCDERWQEWYFNKSSEIAGLTQSSPRIHKSAMKFVTG
eukprot:TRINITY_DN31680_c0_g1_i1.p1 TRINITY_DN31680_c0_g1~~TRINITY_DN31680_c0_g1_i1.p1  ORF type:complete len:426 (-),score=100.72 TRINITY_DN31680_c0_g1_i1:354-1631(-)